MGNTSRRIAKKKLRHLSEGSYVENIFRGIQGKKEEKKDKTQFWQRVRVSVMSHLKKTTTGERLDQGQPHMFGDKASNLE